VRYYAGPRSEDHAVTDRTMKPSAFLTLLLLCLAADALVPVYAARFIEIESGARHTCALTDGGGVQCWGRQAMGGGEYPLVASERYRDANATMIARGTHQGFAIAADGQTLCWGENVLLGCRHAHESVVV